MAGHTRIFVHAALTTSWLAAAGCYQGLEGRLEPSEQAQAEIEDEPFRLVEVRDNGFTAELVLDGEAIQIESWTVGTKTSVTVMGRQNYAAWTVDYAAQQGTGDVAGIPLEEEDPAKWDAVVNGRTAEVLQLVTIGASELASESYADGEDEPPPEPGSDAMLDGLRLLSSLSPFVQARVAKDLVAPETNPPPSPTSPTNMDLAASVDPAATEWVCLPEWECGISAAFGCAGLAKTTKATWFTAVGCAYSLLSSCGFVCPTENYLEFWAGNCLRSAHAWANHSNTIYCVGGGCSTCY